MAKADNTGGVYPLTAASRIQDYTLQDITPTQVNQILREVRNGRLEYVGRLYRMMHDTWPRFRQNINKACRAVSRLHLEVKPGLVEGEEEPTPRAQEIYETIERALESYSPRPGYWELGQTEMLDALMECEAKGPVAVEIIWQIENNIWSPRCYIPVPDRALSYPTNSDMEERLMFARKGAAYDNLQDFPSDKFLVGVRSQGGIHPIFSGAMRPLVKYWMAAVFGMGWYLQYVQLYGIPWRTVETDGSDGAMAKAEEMLSDIGAQGWAVTGKGGGALTIHDAVGGSAENLPQAAIIELANRTCDLIFLGQTLTTDNTGTGSRALGEVHADTLSDMEQERAKWLSDTLNAQLIPAIVRKNYGTLPAEEMPYCCIEIPEVDDEKATAERVKILAEIGVPMTKKWVYETLKVPEPKEGEEIFGAEAKAIEDAQTSDGPEDDDEDYETLPDIEDDDLEDEEIESSFEVVQAKGVASKSPKASAKPTEKKPSATGPKKKGARYFRKTESYDPNQKRFPKGHENAGRWMDEGKGASKGAKAKRGQMRDATPEDLKKLGVPNSYKNVKVTDDKSADLIATGQNPKGSTVYFYSKAYSESQQGVKFARIGALNKEMPSLQFKISADIKSGKNLDQAITLRTITLTGLRNGGEGGRGKVESFGASSLEMRHVKVEGDVVRTDFIGKKGVQQRHSFRDADVANYIKQRQDSGAGANDKVFKSDAGKTLAYLSKNTGGQFKVHDLRTWHGTVLADMTIKKIGSRGEWPTNEKQLQAFKVRVSRVVSRRLGNDPAMALKAYIHPAVFNQVKP